MPDLKPADYRAFAEQCVDMATRAGGDERAALLRMADVWLNLATEELIKHSEVSPDQNAPSTSRTQ